MKVFYIRTLIIRDMILKGVFAGKPAMFQLLLLLFFLLFGAAFSSVVCSGVFFMLHGTTAGMMSHPWMMRMMQLCSALGTFLFPALTVAWLCSTAPREYLCVKNGANVKILLLVLVSMILFSPTITLTSLLNKQMVLPSFMSSVETWMQTQEALAERLTETLLSGNGFMVLLSNLIVVAFMAGITEEFLFRGVLQRIFSRWTTNHHVVIWSAAILFSAFHLQFYGFLPRMLLGAYFGYLLYWSRNIWIPVFAHFVNNAFAVISMSDEKLKANEFISGDISEAHIPAYTALAVITLLLFIACAFRIRKAAK